MKTMPMYSNPFQNSFQDKGLLSNSSTYDMASVVTRSNRTTKYNLNRLFPLIQNRTARITDMTAMPESSSRKRCRSSIRAILVWIL